jgi:hypothetical protein
MRGRPEDDPNRVDALGQSESIVRVQTWSAEVLTCLSTPPAATAFRPPYSGTEKTIFDSLDINRSLIPAIAPTTITEGYLSVPLSGLSAGARYARVFERPWIMLLEGASGEAIRPCDNQHGYYDSGHYAESEASLLLCCDIPDKEELLINFIQYGIDSHYCAKNFVLGTGERGDRCMSKWPGIYAGILLDNEELRTADNGYTLWKTDSCTYYGVGWTHVTYRPTASPALWKMDSTTEEEENHETLSPFVDENWCTGIHHTGPEGNCFWNYEAYRRWNHSHPWVGTKNAATIMGAKTYWDHDAFFDYIDRWMEESDDSYWSTVRAMGLACGCGDMGTYDIGYQQGEIPSSPFVKAMWTAYHDYVFVAEPEEPEEGPWVMIYG